MYIDFGFYQEALVNLVRKGAEGEQQIKAMMGKFRTSSPVEIASQKVVRVLDYKTRQETNLISGEVRVIELPASDVLQFYTEDGSKISVRPSGTEPKIKFYISVHGILTSKEDFELAKQALNEKMDKIEKDIIQ